MDVMAIYNRLPIALQNAACEVEGMRLRKLRYGGPFEELLTGYLENSAKSEDELLSIRNGKLETMVRYCYEQVPYYTKLFDEYGLDPFRVHDERDLNSLPILTKDVIRSNPDDFKPVNRSAADPCITESTSGSTGSSLTFDQSVGNVRDLWAVFWRFWMDKGADRSWECADFGSRTIVPASQTSPPFWRECRALNQVKFSAFHANEQNYRAYAKRIDDGAIRWIHGYPSRIVPFAAFMIENGISFRKPIRLITTSAENLYPHQRRLIFQAFGVEPYSLYSLTEGTACISESSSHEMLIDEDYSLVELIEGDGGCRIVSSNLTNFAFPLLRYDTGDLCTFDGEKVRGRRKVSGIDGRNAELIRLPDGGTVGTLSALFTESSTIKEAQLVQHADLSVTVKYVPLGVVSLGELAAAEKKFVERTRGLIPVEFTEVESIERTSRGKLRYVVSEIRGE